MWGGKKYEYFPVIRSRPFQFSIPRFQSLLKSNYDVIKGKLKTNFEQALENQIIPLPFKKDLPGQIELNEANA